MNVFFDIETTPSVDPTVHALIAEDIKPPGSMKKAETIAAWEQNEKPAAIHEAIAKTSLDGAFGNICVIGVALNDEEPIAFFEDSTEPHRHEAKVLSEFFMFLRDAYSPSSQTRPVFIGHNIVNFDLRFMFQRAVILGVAPPAFIPFTAKAWDPLVFDTMVQWAGHKDYISADKLAKALGLPGKQGITGADVWPMVAAGRIKEVAHYCTHTDVAQAREMFRRLTFQQAA